MLNLDANVPHEDDPIIMPMLIEQIQNAKDPTCIEEVAEYIKRSIFFYRYTHRISNDDNFDDYDPINLIGARVSYKTYKNFVCDLLKEIKDNYSFIDKSEAKFNKTKLTIIISDDTQEFVMKDEGLTK